MNVNPLNLRLLSLRLAVCRLASAEPFPPWASRGEFFAITRTPDELSVVCPEANVPAGTVAERGWRALRVVGTINFAVVGIVAALTVPVANAGIGVFVISTLVVTYANLKGRQ